MIVKGWRPRAEGLVGETDSRETSEAVIYAYRVGIVVLRPDPWSLSYSLACSHRMKWMQEEEELLAACFTIAIPRAKVFVVVVSPKENSSYVPGYLLIPTYCLRETRITHIHLSFSARLSLGGQIVQPANIAQYGSRAAV